MESSYFQRFFKQNSSMDETYKVDIDKDTNNLVYLLILSHGSVRFRNNKPIPVTIPEEIKYINKITYAPLDCVNYIENDRFIKHKIKEILDPNPPSQDQTPLVEHNLVESLESNIQLLEIQKKKFENNRNTW